MEIHDDLDYDDHVDSYDPVELPTKPQTPCKPKLIVPNAVSEETSCMSTNLPKATEPILCSKSVIFEHGQFSKIIKNQLRSIVAVGIIKQ